VREPINSCNGVNQDLFHGLLAQTNGWDEDRVEALRQFMTRAAPHTQEPTTNSSAPIWQPMPAATSAGSSSPFSDFYRILRVPPTKPPDYLADAAAPSLAGAVAEHSVALAMPMGRGGRGGGRQEPYEAPLGQDAGTSKRTSARFHPYSRPAPSSHTSRLVRCVQRSAPA